MTPSARRTLTFANVVSRNSSTQPNVASRIPADELTFLARRRRLKYEIRAMIRLRQRRRRRRRRWQRCCRRRRFLSMLEMRCAAPAAVAAALKRPIRFAYM